MSGNNLSGNDEFDEQLRMQELYGGDPKEGDTQNEPSGETDSLGQPPDDTPYEWDLDKKAWFPKVRKSSLSPTAERGHRAPWLPLRDIPVMFASLKY